MKKKQLIIYISLFLLCSNSYAGIKVGSGNDNPVEMFALLLGGLGFFLIGIHFAGSHFQKITGGTFKAIIQKLSGNSIGSFSWGMFLGFFTQSGKANAFILADFERVGLISVRNSLPVVFWGNVGSALIIFASMIPMKIFALSVIGITAFGITFNYPKRLVQLFGALFGVAMIMYGLMLVKSGAGGAAGYSSVSSILSTMRGHVSLCFLLGFVATLLVQSNLAIMMLAISLAGSGLFTLEEAALGIYGAQAGTAAVTYIYSFHAKGRARQVIMSQIVFDVFACLLFTALFIIERLIGQPLLIGPIQGMITDLSLQVTTLALTFQFFSAGFAVLLRRQFLQLIEYYFPPSDVEVLAEVKFIQQKLAGSAEVSLMLVEQEQLRLIKRLPQYIEFFRNNSEKELTSPNDYHEAFLAISQLISNSLSEVSKCSLNSIDSERLISITKQQEQLVNLEWQTFKLTESSGEQSNTDKSEQSLSQNIMESLDAMVLTAIDAIESKGDFEIEMLLKVTGDRSKIMERVRQNYFNNEKGLSLEERNFILDITILLENTVYTLSRYAKLIQAEKRDEAS